jgi:arsenate reductase-like glutaredoxin family protein
LPAAEQEKAATKDGAIELMRANTSLIKRPVIEYQGKILVGYDETSLAKNFL